ncbi:uncharacterized protein PG998_011982 [Apiospora kogelbergensis]|uniref:uncharacterized protein n=1 Tax=Apiospora kogelbergensis TaxID=1337665 RepID=UPI00312D7449
MSLWSPHARETTHHQRQIVLRNSSSPESGLALSVRLLWAWRSAGRRPWLRVLPLLSLAFFSIALFTIAGVLSSKISTAGEVLLKGDKCQIPNRTQSSTSNTTSEIPVDMDMASYINNIANYAQQCYSNTTSGLLECSRFIINSIPTGRVEFDTPCPFKEGLCRRENSTIRLDTGHLNGNDIFGLNAPKDETLTFRYVVQYPYTVSSPDPILEAFESPSFGNEPMHTVVSPLARSEANKVAVVGPVVGERRGKPASLEIGLGSDGTDGALALVRDLVPDVFQHPLDLLPRDPLLHRRRVHLAEEDVDQLPDTPVGDGKRALFRLLRQRFDSHPLLRLFRCLRRRRPRLARLARVRGRIGGGPHFGLALGILFSSDAGRLIQGSDPVWWEIPVKVDCGPHAGEETTPGGVLTSAREVLSFWPSGKGTRVQLKYLAFLGPGTNCGFPTKVLLEARFCRQDVVSVAISFLQIVLHGVYQTIQGLEVDLELCVQMAFLSPRCFIRFPPALDLDYQSEDVAPAFVTVYRTNDAIAELPNVPLRRPEFEVPHGSLPEWLLLAFVGRCHFYGLEGEVLLQSVPEDARVFPHAEEERSGTHPLRVGEPLEKRPVDLRAVLVDLETLAIPEEFFEPVVVVFGVFLGWLGTPFRGVSEVRFGAVVGQLRDILKVFGPDHVFANIHQEGVDLLLDLQCQFPLL